MYAYPEKFIPQKRVCFPCSRGQELMSKARDDGRINAKRQWLPHFINLFIYLFIYLFLGKGVSSRHVICMQHYACLWFRSGGFGESFCGLYCPNVIVFLACEDTLRCENTLFCMEIVKRQKMSEVSGLAYRFSGVQ